VSCLNSLQSAVCRGVFGCLNSLQFAVGSLQGPFRLLKQFAVGSLQGPVRLLRQFAVCGRQFAGAFSVAETVCSLRSEVCRGVFGCLNSLQFAVGSLQEPFRMMKQFAVWSPQFAGAFCLLWWGVTSCKLQTEYCKLSRGFPGRPANWKLQTVNSTVA
jgi:hypothetical protein